MKRIDAQKLKNLAHRYGIELMILFGSRARGDARPDSDLDLGVLFQRMPSPRQLGAFEEHALDLFQDDVHLVPLNFVNPELRVAAEREGKILYERTPGIFAGFTVENLHRLHQYYYLREYDRDLLNRFVEGKPNDQNLHHPAARQMLASIAEAVTRLKEVKQRSLAAYLADWKTMAITERIVTQIINYTIDVNRFALNLANVLAPNNYYDTFIEMGRQKILPARLAKQLAATTAVRNRLEHEYDTIDHTRVYVLSKKAPTWFREYIRHLNRWLDTHENSSANDTK